MDRQEAEDYVYSSYLKAERFLDRDDPDSVKRDPGITKGLLEALSVGTPCVCVTGSKGKGSVCAMISEIMGTDVSVGMMTSPHIRSFNERFRIDGEPISDEDFVEYAQRTKNLTDVIEYRLSPRQYISPMGIQAAIAMMHFSGKTGFNVFECGKGAMYDDVNNIVHPYSVINTVFLEHVRELGPELRDIAYDKSCIIKEGQRCAYCGEQSPEVLEIIRARAELCGVPLKVYGQDFFAYRVRSTDEGLLFDVKCGWDVYEDIRLPFLGRYQAKNCALAMALCQDVMISFRIEDIRERLSKMRWPGRTEIVRREPLTVLDACINRSSCSYLKDIISDMGMKRITLIVGIPDDKDYAGVVSEMLPFAGKVILSRSHNPHYVFTDVQMRTMSDMGIDAEFCESVGEAAEISERIGDPTFVLGTTSFVSEAETYFDGLKR